MKAKHFTFCILHFALLLSALPIKAQTLPSAQRNSTATLVYRLTKDDVRALHLKGKSVTEKMLHTFVTSYEGSQYAYDLGLERGNYILVRAISGQLDYTEYVEDNFAGAEFLNGTKPQIVLLDSLGVPIIGARIDGWKYNARSNSYVASKVKEDKVYEIDNNGVYHYIRIDKEPIYRYYYQVEEPSWLARQWTAIKSWFKKKPDVYDGFIAFSKPKYKPNEKVRLKAYLTLNGKLYDKAVDVVLQRPRDMGGDTILMHLAPYRTGMYETEFELSDDLKLRIDYNYGISLRTAEKSSMLTDYFRYEEYELKSLKFTATMSESEYQASDSVEVNLNAVDENGLGVYDGRVEITILPQSWSGNAIVPQVFVPDTIYSEKIDMQGLADKMVTIPSTAFPVGYSGYYSVYCEFMTADNERREQHLYFNRAGEDTPRKERETAPTAIFVRSDGQIKLSFDNPDSLPIWYSVYEGKKLLEQGYGEAVARAYKAKEKGYSLQYWYYSEEDKAIQQGSASLPYVSQNITMSVTAPSVIYPGQEVEVGVDVVDRKGKAVQNVDITAYSYTSKFANTGYVRPVRLNFNGINDQTAPKADDRFDIYDKFYSEYLKMDWSVWRERLGLDSLEFYKFLHPAPVYKYTDTIESTGATILPFVVVDGDVVGVQILYIDDQPVYLKAAQQREVYAFAIPSGYHRLRFRLPDREVRYSDNFKSGERLIFSIDASATNEKSGIYVTMLPKKQNGTLSDKELDNLNPYMISLTTTPPYTQLYSIAVNEPSYTQSGNLLYDVTNRSYDALVGPFPYMGSRYRSVNLMRADSTRVNWFNIYGAKFNYHVDWHHIVVAQRNENAIPTKLSPYRPSFNLWVNPLTTEQLNDEFEERIKDMFASYGGAANAKTDKFYQQNGYGCELRVSFGYDNEEHYLRPMLIQIDTLLYYGNTTSFDELPEGEVTMRVIMRDGKQYVTTLNLQKGGINYVSVDKVELMPADSVSEGLYASLRQNYSQSSGGNTYYDEIEYNSYSGYTTYYTAGSNTGAIYGSRAMSSEMSVEYSEVADYNQEATYKLEGSVAGLRETGQGATELSSPQPPMPDMTGYEGGVRHNFSDDAFWQPRLTTDSAGHATFKTTFPDDITQWTANFIAIGTPKQTAQKTIYINSYLPLSARLSVPNFAIRGDKFNAIGKLTSYSDDSVKVSTPFGEVTFVRSYTTSIAATAGDTDSLTLEYSLTAADGFSDGERRTLPIYPVGTMESKGDFVVLENGNSHTFMPDQAGIPVTIHADATQLGSLLEEIDRTVKYAYGCNEQMASKVKALVSKRLICRTLGREFYKESDEALKKYIAQILKNRNADGFWGWWGTSDTELWLSAHVVEALAKAKTEGYEVAWDIEQMTGTMMRALRTQNIELTDMVLVILHQIGATADYATLYNSLPALSKQPTIRERLARLETKAILELADSTDAVAIINMGTPTVFGGLAWSEKQDPNMKRYIVPSPEYTTTENTLTAYRALQLIEDILTKPRMGITEDARAKIRRYLFEQRRLEGWGNTYSTSRTIEAILPDLMEDMGSVVIDPVLVVNGERITGFPYTATFEDTDKIEVSSEGTSPVFVTAYQQIWNPAPTAVSTDFSVLSKFVQDGKEVTELTAGEPVDLVVTVMPHASASYVMIEVPIPAGCSYEEHYQNRWSEIHREYLKEKVSIFVRSINVQPNPNYYTYTIKLIPRYTGSYTLNPARMELMYFPTFYGRTAVEQVEIK